VVSISSAALNSPLAPKSHVSLCHMCLTMNRNFPDYLRNPYYPRYPDYPCSCCVLYFQETLLPLVTGSHICKCVKIETFHCPYL
jgi:hypothetical protein